MIKKLSIQFLLMILISTAVFSQADTLSFNYTGVDSVKDAKANALYSRAKLFITNEFKSAKDVIQMDDPESHTLVVKGLLRPYVSGPGPFGAKGYWGYAKFTITIQTKDEKYKYTISDFYHEGGGSPGAQGGGGDFANEKPACGGLGMTKKQWRNIKQYVNDDIVKMVSSLKSEMQKNTTDF